MVHPAGIEPITVGVTESVREAVAKLDAVVEVEASNWPLRKVIKQLEASADVNIVLDKAGLEETEVTAETAVSLKVQGITLRSALQLVLQPLKLGHVFDGEVLKITSRERAAGPAIVVAYPIADLLGVGDSPEMELRLLSDLVVATLGGERQWSALNPSLPKVHCDGATKTLVVRHTRAMHADVASFLELLRKTERVAANVEAAAMLALSPEEQRIIEKLRTKTSVHFEQAPLQQVVKHLAKQAGINIVLDRTGLEDVGETPTTLVNLNLADVRLSTVLRLLLEPLELDYVVKNEVLQITSRQRAEGVSVIATYPVADLVWRENDPSGDLSSLCDMLMSMIEPNSWDVVGGGASVRTNVPTRSLVVRQTRGNHARIRDLLETLRKTQSDKSDSQ